MELNINDKAPDFASVDQNGEKLALEDSQGKWVALYFYPRADTPG
jgi:peroxiredoxin Q/BCP